MTEMEKINQRLKKLDRKLMMLYVGLGVTVGVYVVYITNVFG